MIQIFAPGSIGNVGPGFDILGLAVEGIGDTIIVEESDRHEITIEGRDAQLIPTDPKENTVTLAADAYFKKYGIQRRLRIELRRQLPSSGGLGASAASSVAGALAAATILGKADDKEGIVKAALVAEAHVAGKHLDNIAPCVYGGMTLVQSTEPISIYRIRNEVELTIALFTPSIKIRTKESRTVLPSSLESSVWIQQMANTSALTLGMAQGNIQMIRSGLNDLFSEPNRQHLIPGFIQAKEAAMNHGALGFSISGAGPTCFALFESLSQANASIDHIRTQFPSECSVHVGRIAKNGARVL